MFLLIKREREKNIKEGDRKGYKEREGNRTNER